MCFVQAIDRMVLAADERRHGGVIAYLSEVVGYAKLYRDCVAEFEKGQADGTIGILAQAPCLSWFSMQFWPANEHVRSAFQYTGRFPLKMQLQIRNLRKHHPHTYYCAKQRKNLKAWAFNFARHVLAIGGDDKATANIGEPGTAVSVLAKQRKVASAAFGNQLSALDHEAGHVRVKMVPTVLMKHNEPTDPECSWYSGVIKVILKNSIYEGSNAFGAMAELLVNYAAELSEKSVFLLHTDGGGEHNLPFPSVQAAICAFVLKANPDHGVWTNSAPYHSFSNEPERIMSILNLAMYGVAVERPPMDPTKFPGEESRFRRTKTIAELRAAATAFPKLREGLHDSLEPVFELFYERFGQLSLDDIPFERGEHVSDSAVDDLFAALRGLLADDASDITRTDLKRKHLECECKFKRFWATHFTADRYKIEFDKACWRSQLGVLRAQNGGALPPDKVSELFSTYKCEFGCPPPRMSASEFLDMKPVPRPKEPAGVSGKYLSFEESYGKETPYCAPPLDHDAATELAPSGTTVGDNVRATIKCSVCPHKRAVYTKAKISRMRIAGDERTGQQILDDFLETVSGYVCGDDLGETAQGDTTEVIGCLLKGTARPYVRLKLCCSTTCESQLYTMKPPRPLTDTELKAMCSICGDSGRIMQELSGDCLTEGAFLPTCKQCYAQHNAFRPSGRRATVRYDRSAQREVSSTRTCNRAQTDTTLPSTTGTSQRCSREAR